MPQQRTEIPVVGIWPALRWKILPLVKQHRRDAAALVKAAGPRTRTCNISVPNPRRWTERVPDDEVLETMLSDLTLVAVEPTGTIVRNCIPPGFLFQCYAVAPELTISVLNAARKIWFKDSAASRLWRWLASNEGIRPLPHKPSVSVWECTDCELATGYEHATGNPAEVDDVLKARKKLAGDISRGMKLRLKLGGNFGRIPSG